MVEQSTDQTLEKANAFLHFGPESKNLSSARDVVIIRPPKSVSTEKINDLAKKLEERGFLTVIEPEEPEYLEAGIACGSTRPWPTDFLREIGPWVLRSEPTVPINRILDFVRTSGVNLGKFYGCIIDVPYSFRGGDYVYLEANKVFVYAQNRLFKNGSLGRSDSEKINEDRTAKILEMLKSNGWSIYPVDTSLFDMGKPDLDFLLSLFLGGDGKTHAIIPEAFFSQVPSRFKTHIIPDKEVYSGVCNIADLRRGSILVIPHEDQAPSTYGIIKKHVHSSIDVIEAPPNFLERDGGPRCSITSFSIR